MVMNEHLKLDALIIFCHLSEVIKKNKVSFRCHDSARVTAKVLERLGYEDVKVIDGSVPCMRYKEDYDDRPILHSWVEVNGKILHYLPKDIFREEAVNYEIIDKSDDVARCFEWKNHERVYKLKYPEGYFDSNLVKTVANLLIKRLKRIPSMSKRMGNGRGLRSTT